ncbi:MAG: hypothetical protein OEW60_08825 [Thiovulaceae bacterium]|nr:hypothetical protein [Sulfurimonadaceae bacterium]
MRLESLIPLIDATLYSKPEIHTFNNISVKANKVLRGDLYIALNATQADINTAIENGAYGIVYDLPLLIIDDEIAWLKVDSVIEAEHKLLRFHLMQKELEVFYSTEVTVAYIKMLKNSSDLLIIEENFETSSHKLWNVKSGQTLVIKEQEGLQSIFPMAERIETVTSSLSIHPVTPFESDLSLDYHYYKRLKLPKALALNFSQALTFFVAHNIPFNLANLVFPKFCDIVSCDKNLGIKDFGQGVKTLIFLPSDDYVEYFTQSIDELAPWIDYQLFVQNNEKDLGYNNVFTCSDTQNCIQGLQNNHFDYALVIGQSKALLEHVTKPLQASLF